MLSIGERERAKKHHTPEADFEHGANWMIRRMGLELHHQIIIPSDCDDSWKTRISIRICMDARRVEQLRNVYTQYYTVHIDLIIEANNFGIFEAQT